MLGRGACRGRSSPRPLSRHALPTRRRAWRTTIDTAAAAAGTAAAAAGAAAGPLLGPPPPRWRWDANPPPAGTGGAGPLPPCRRWLRRGARSTRCARPPLPPQRGSCPLSLAGSLVLGVPLCCRARVHAERRNKGETTSPRRGETVPYLRMVHAERRNQWDDKSMTRRNTTVHK